MSWENFGKYIGVQGVLAIALTATMIACTLARIPIQEQLYTLMGLAWGFYFAKNGSKIVSDYRAKH